MRRFLARRPTGAELALGAAVLLWLAITLPWVTGERILVLRDTLTTHAHLKAFGAAELAAGRIPAVNPQWGLGQPFRGNPNALPFYPGNLFYLFLPFGAAFHLHYALHWLLAFLGLRQLAGELGQGEAGRTLSALAWAGSGWMLSMLTFYNLLAVVAWLPFVLWGIARGGRRGVALGGVACGLLLLGGEPMTAALAALAMLFVALDRHGARRGIPVALAVGGIGLLVALPQIVATARVAAFSFRVAHGLDADQFTYFGFSPFRLLELVLPLPWGWPADLGRFTFWSQRVTPEIPYVFTIHFGVVAAALAALALRRRARWAGLAGFALALAWAATAAPRVTAAASGGLFRYGQKFLVLFALAAALLAGWGLEAALGRVRPARALAVAGAALAGIGGALRLLRAPFTEWLRVHFATAGRAELAIPHAGAWIVGLVAAGALLGAAAWGVKKGWPGLVLAAELVGLLQLAPAVASDAAAPYRQDPPLLASLGAPRTVVPVPSLIPDWERRLPFPIEVANAVGQARISWFELEPPFGVPRGLSYPLAPDLEGLATPLHVFLYRNLQLADWRGRVPWLARLGVGWVVRFAGTAAPGLERVRVESQFGVPVELDRVPDPAPPLAWPEEVAVAPNPVLAFPAVANRRIPATTAVASRPVAHHAGGRLTLLEREPDRWVFDVDSAGGLAVVQTAWHPIWRARLEDGRALATQPVDIALTGVEVPPGRHRVTLAIAAWPEALAGAIAAAAAATALLVAARRGA